MKRRTNGNKAPRWGRAWPWLTVLAVYAVISWFSTQPGDVSDAQTMLVQDLMGNQSEWFAIIVRKLAHVSLFLFQGAACCFAWLRHDAGKSPLHGRYRRAVWRSIALCALLGGLDEFHQLFVAGRAALVSDMLLDTLGAALGALCLAGLARRLERRKAA